MNEMKPGERPDTIHVQNLPTKWFINTQVLKVIIKNVFSSLSALSLNLLLTITIISG